jgi:hypothetical protein
MQIMTDDTITQKVMDSVQYDRDSNRNLHFTSFHLVEPQLPVHVDGLHEALHFSRSRPATLAPLHSRSGIFRIHLNQNDGR